MFEAFLKRRKISHAECAKILGTPRMTIWRWATGTVRPSHFARQAVQEKLGFTWPERG